MTRPEIKSFGIFFRYVWYLFVLHSSLVLHFNKESVEKLCLTIVRSSSNWGMYIHFCISLWINNFLCLCFNSSIMILSFIRSSTLLNDKLLNLIFTLTKKLFFFCSVDLCFFIEGFIPSDIRYSMLTAEANLPPTKKTRSVLNFINLQEISKTRFCDVKFIQKNLRIEHLHGPIQNI